MPPQRRSRLARLCRHFADRGAQTKKSNQATREGASLALSALATASGIVPTLVSGWFASTPILLAILTGGVVALASCIWVVAASTAHGPPPATDRRYRFSQLVRNGAKAMAALLLALIVLAGWRISPNGLRRTQMLSGNICSALSDQPVVGVAVEVLDRAGRPVAVRSERTGDDGFFVHDLTWGGQAPAELRIHAGACPVQSVSVDSAILAEGCTSFGDSDVPRGPRRPKWSISCPAR